eukprot:7879234-Pyramimonas_sp.AAC.1
MTGLRLCAAHVPRPELIGRPAGSSAADHFLLHAGGYSRATRSKKLAFTFYRITKNDNVRIVYSKRDSLGIKWGDGMLS